MLWLLARWLHKTHCNCTIIAHSSSNAVDLYASPWPQTARINMQREYSSLATASVRQCSTCYGRDGTVASRSINTERGSAALVLTRKQKAIVWPSVSFEETFKNSITNLYKDELANVLEHDNHVHGVLHVIVGATGNNSLISISEDFYWFSWEVPCMGLQVLFAP